MSGKDLQKYISRLKDAHDKKMRGNSTLLQRKRQSMVPRSTLIGKYSTTHDREDEGRINTETEEDYRRWSGGVDTRRMAREAAQKQRKRKW